MYRSIPYLISLIFTSAVVQGDGESSWQWTIEPYLMATSIDGDAGIGRVTGAEVEVDTDQILENLEIGFMVHAEALHKSDWGIIVDYAFMKIGSDISGPRGGVLDTEVRQGVLEAFAFKRTEFEKSHLDMFAGIRWWDNDFDVTVVPSILPGSISGSRDVDWVDPVIGLRYAVALDDSEQWQLSFVGDIGGFGVGSDLTYTLVGAVGYQISESWKVELKYKSLWVDYEEGTKGTSSYFSYETATHGPILSVAYEF